MELLNKFLKPNNKITFICNFILSLFSLATQLFLFFYYINQFPIYIYVLSFVSILYFLFVCINNLINAIKLSSKVQKLDVLKKHNESLSVLYDNTRGFKHDFDNIITTIGGYVYLNDMDGLKKYYNQLEGDCQKTNNISTLDPIIINNPGIYGLLTAKYKKAYRKNIKIDLKFFVDLNEFDINMYKFSRVLGILLDNAIEAASECKEKIINIKFLNEKRKNRHTIIIENTFNDKNLNTDKIFEKGISSKANHSGLGLWEIRKYVSKSKNLNLFTCKNEKYFVQQFEIYYNNNKNRIKA